MSSEDGLDRLRESAGRATKLHVRGCAYYGLDDVRRACLVGRRESEWVSWIDTLRDVGRRQELTGGELFPGQDWGEDAGGRWCASCERWWRYGELSVSREVSEGRKIELWWVSCAECGEILLITRNGAWWIIRNYVVQGGNRGARA